MSKYFTAYEARQISSSVNDVENVMSETTELIREASKEGEYRLIMKGNFWGRQNVEDVYKYIDITTKLRELGYTVMFVDSSDKKDDELPVAEKYTVIHW